MASSENIDVEEFASDAAALRAVNEVYVQAYLDEQELARWPRDGSLPASLRECCIAIAGSEAELSEVPGDVGPAQMTSHGETSDVHVVPPWTSAIDEAAEDDTSAPVMWSTLAAKLEEAADLGSRIKLRETEARVMEASDAVDDIGRDVLLKTCGTLTQCFKNLSKAAQDARLEQMCARVIEHSSTAPAEVSHAGLSASRVAGPVPAASSGTSRLVVPAGKQPLDLFDPRVWTKWIQYVSGTTNVSGGILVGLSLWPWQITMRCACAGRSSSTARKRRRPTTTFTQPLQSIAFGRITNCFT